MEKILIDSSVWIDYFKRGEGIIGENVNFLLDEDRVFLCGMVELEILQGLRGKESSKVQNLFNILPFVETNRDDFRAAGMILNQLRSKGVTIPSSDCLIATLCLRYGLSLFTLDQDFNHITALKKYSPFSN